MSARKKSSTKKAKLDSSSTLISEKLKLSQALFVNYLAHKRKRLSNAASVFKQWFLNIPTWVKNRPAAIKEWRKADRKKKKYRSFRLQNRLNPDPRYIPSSFSLLRQAFRTYRKNFWVFFCVMVVQAVLYYVFVRGASSFDLTNVQESIKSLFGNNSGTTGTLALLGSVIGSQQQKPGSNIYNFLIYMTISLADIWIIRRIYLKKAFKIREAFYQGFGSFIPVLVVLAVIILQSLPFMITSYIYILGRTNNLFISGVEDLAFFLVAFFCGLLSLYWMTPSLMAIYAVTLPNMFPLRTIRLTKKVVKFRRFVVFRKVIALPIMMGVIYLVLLLLCVRFAPQYSTYIAEALPILLLPLLHSYYFILYRSLL